MRVLITGAAGMLGQDVQRSATAAGHEPVALARAELDITDRAAVQAAVADAKPHVLINCAAWTDVDGAEAQEQAATAVNGDGTGNLAQAAAAHGTHMIHISSDYVFDGSKHAPYVESDPPSPLSAYGRSKLAGEHMVASAAPGNHTIVRSSWLFGAGGRCFPATILQLAAERDELSIVDDQRGCPTFTGHLARALVQLARTRPAGIVHLAGAGDCTWFEFAQRIVQAGGLTCEVKPGRTAELGRPAPRPQYSVLGTERAELPTMPHWREGLSEFMALTVGTR